jgi:hypothetical protein
MAMSFADMDQSFQGKRGEQKAENKGVYAYWCRNTEHKWPAKPTAQRN